MALRILPPVRAHGKHDRWRAGTAPFGAHARCSTCGHLRPPSDLLGGFAIFGSGFGPIAGRYCGRCRATVAATGGRFVQSSSSGRV